MEKSKLFLSSCGTSLLTNSLPDHLRQFINKTTNFNEAEIKANYPEELKEFSQFVETRQKQLLSDDTDLTQVQKMSAELNALITYYGGVLPTNTADQHYLLRTDTYQAKLTAEMVATWLKKYKINATVKVIDDLKTDNADNFRIGMSNLMNWCEEEIKPFRGSYDIIFNLTGGFKSVQGFLQTIGMFYADEILYIFQSSKELLRIPRLPINLDVNTRQEVADNLTTFRLLASGKQLPVSQCKNISETLLFPLDGDVALSTWGELIWNQLKSDFYQKELLPPLNPNKLDYSDKFIKSIKDITGDRLETLNKRLDDLSRHLEDKSYNPRSLDFKELKGKPLKDSTHELDVWSDQGKRIYGHFTGDKLIIDQLGEHL